MRANMVTHLQDYMWSSYNLRLRRDHDIITEIEI